MRDWRAYVKSHLTGRLHDRAREAEILEELAQQFEDRYTEALLSGASEDEAAAIAVAEIPEWESFAREIQRLEKPAKQTLPESSSSGLVAGAWQDMKIGLRALKKGPGFAAITVITLALGIGATAAIFSIVYAVLLRPLPYLDAGRLMVLQGSHAERRDSPWSVSPPDFEDWKREADAFEAMALTTYWSFNVVGLQAPERVVGARVTGEFFDLLGVPALLGRTLTEDDDRPGAPDTAVLSYGFWQRMFGADREILGRTLVLNGRSHTVVGVMPSYFSFPSEDVVVWGALADNMGEMPRDSRFLLVVARLKRGAKPKRAQAEMDQVAAELELEYAETNKGWGVKVLSAHQTIVGDVRTALWTLMGAVGFVLLIACANVANLQLSRQAVRQQELAIRTALGAGPWRVMRQVLVENLLLTLFGSACGIGIAYLAVDWLKRLYPGEVPRLVDAQVNWTVMAFAVSLAVVTAIVLAVASTSPWSGRWAVDDALKESRQSLAGGRRLEYMRRVFVTVQVALALVLLVGGGLLGRSFLRVAAIEPGFRLGNLLTFNVWPTTSAYQEEYQQKDYIRRSLGRLKSLSGVEAVAAISQLPLSTGRTALKFEVEGKPLPRENAPEADYRSVSPNYFNVMGIPILRGRSLTSFDREQSQKVVVINETMARRFWAGENPVGNRIRWVDPDRDVGWLAVVGVVGDVKSQGLDAEERPAVYVPYDQRTHPHMRWTGFVVRTQGDAAALWPSVREVFVGIDPTIPVYDVRTMDDLMESSVGERRFYAHLLGGFAIVALLLGTVGVYGVISYSVSRRTHEMGLRMALGAQAVDVMRLVVRQGMKPAILGLGVGMISALALTQWMKSMLFEISATDPVTFFGVTVGLGLVALVACTVPALRATRVDPSSALRHE